MKKFAVSWLLLVCVFFLDWWHDSVNRLTWPRQQARLRVVKRGLFAEIDEPKTCTQCKEQTVSSLTDANVDSRTEKENKITLKAHARVFTRTCMEEAGWRHSKDKGKSADTLYNKPHLCAAERCVLESSKIDDRMQLDSLSFLPLWILKGNT